MEQGVGRNLAAVHFDHVIKRVIHRRLQDNGAAGFAEQLHGQAQCGDNACDGGNPVFLDGPLMASGEPVCNGIPALVGHHGIAVNTLGGAAFNRFFDGGRAFEIHVRHPKRQDIGVAE
ncbi:hypothetical protein D3C75_1006820 [compost metagenome]